MIETGIPAIPQLQRETLQESAAFQLTRGGRFLVAELRVPHLVLSTSACNGGQSGAVRYLLNHQSCEAAAHKEREDALHAGGLGAYHERTCAEAGLPAADVALMGTAANMNYAAVVRHESEGVAVTAVVTAGVQGNAACAGDPATWHEGAEGFARCSPYAGTINTMVLVGRTLAPQALAGAAIALTEGKAAALQRLAVRSRYSRDYATGTTTDQFCIAAPREAFPAITSAGTGVRTGELITRAVRDATLEALRWQNGLEPSYARSIFHVMGVYGVRKETFAADMAPWLSTEKLRLLEANAEAIAYEPLVAAAAFAMAGVLDRVRHGILPAGAAREALRQQAATMAVALAAKPACWAEFHRLLDAIDGERPANALFAAIAMGWTAKWQ